MPKIQQRVGSQNVFIMPKFKITARRDFGRIKEGQSFIVVSWTTEPLTFPLKEHIKQVLYLNGYRDKKTLSKSSKWTAWDAVIVDESDCREALEEQGGAYLQALKQYVEDNSYYTKFICTLILVLPIWWVIKLFIKLGFSAFLAILYIISWPIRAMLCCCLSEKQRSFLPLTAKDVWPAYSFKRF